MKKWIRWTLWSLVTLTAIAYVGACVWLRANETRLIFSRNLPYTPPSPSLALNQEQVQLADFDGTKFFAWLIPSAREDTSNSWVIFFHGSGDNVSKL